MVGLAVLLTLLIDVFMDGASRLGWQFLTSYPSRKPEQAGILSAWVGTAWVMALTFIIAFPLGVAAAVYLEEYSKKTGSGTLLRLILQTSQACLLLSMACSALGSL